MISDTERREVARRLREYVDLPDDWWLETSSEFYVEKCVFGNVDRHRESELFARLADLIEPTTGDYDEGYRAGLQKARDMCDREALLALADEMEGDARYWLNLPCDQLGSRDVIGYADRIREALGVQDA